LMRPPADRSTASLKALFTCARATVMAPSYTDSLFGDHSTTAEIPSLSKALRAWPLFSAEVGTAKDNNGRAAIQAAGHSD
jgi:2-phospho-L-lactate guanylyltransferase (CobY/MobA/RfbA family)